MRRSVVLAACIALGTSACDRGEALASAPTVSEEARLDEPYGEAPDGSLFRYTNLAKLKAIEIVPKGLSPDEELPIVVMLHGLADEPRLPSAFTRHPQRPVRIILPRGPYVFEQGFAWYPYRAREGKHEEMRVALEGTAHHFALYLRALEERHRPPCRPIVVGFSQGGMVTLATAISRPEALSEALVAAAWIPPVLVPPQAGELRPPIRLMHGLRDRIVSPEPAMELFDLLRDRGFDVELHLFDDAAHAMSSEMNTLLSSWIEGALERCTARSGR